MSQVRKVGIVDYLYANLKTKFTSEGAGVPSISWAGCEAAFKFLEDEYGIECDKMGIRGHMNLWYFVREFVGFTWESENLQDFEYRVQGKWPKRFATYLNNEHDRLLPYKADGTLAKVSAAKLASVVSKYRVEHKEVVFDFSPIDWRAGEFADWGSCFWQKQYYDEHRKWMIKEKFLACRIWNGDVGAGRCFIVPTNDGEIGLFNGYGMRLIDYAQLILNFVKREKLMPEPRIVEVYLDVRKNSENADLHPNRECYLITSRTDIRHKQSVAVDFGWAPSGCARCDKTYDQAGGWKISHVEEWALCETCYNKAYQCAYCHKALLKEIAYEKVNGRRVPLHPACLENLSTCSECGEYWTELRQYDDKSYCAKCSTKAGLASCKYCGNAYRRENEHDYCPGCVEELALAECEVCHSYRTGVEIRADGVRACSGCVWYCAAQKGGKEHHVYYSVKTDSGNNYYCPECRKEQREH